MLIGRPKGVKSVTADLAAQLVAIEGNAPPSSIVSAIESTGRDAILRGSGQPNSAAVCILETHAKVPDYVKGLARMVQVAPNVTLIDLSIKGLSPGKYSATIRTSGNISQGPESAGDVWEATEPAVRESGVLKSRGILGTVEVGKSGIGSVFIDKPVQVWEIIGRSMVLSKARGGNDVTPEKLSKEDPDTLVGVIARSAGLWENDKTVCSCSGKTVWEERKEQVDRGML
jgi:copper chaperone for superoxide dismutase